MLEKPLGGRGILLGGVPGVAAANVMVIGGGVVGMNAAFIAIGMEADVFVFDVIDRPPARARRRLRRPLLDRLLVDARDRGDAAARRPRDRRGARPRRQGAVRRPPRAAGADEAERGARRRRDRPGRLLRDLAPDHPPRPDLRGRRDHPLLRRQHARRGADHLDLRAHQRDAARTRSRSPTTASREAIAARSRACALGVNVAARQGHPSRRSPRRVGAGVRRRSRRRSSSRTSKANWNATRGERDGNQQTTKTKLQNFIDGEFVDPADGETEDVVNPATGEAIAEAPLSTKEDVDRAVAAAREAFEGWATTTPGERGLALLKLADAIEERADEIADLEAADAGKPRQQLSSRTRSRSMVDNLRFFAGAGALHGGQGRGRVHGGPHLDASAARPSASSARSRPGTTR